RPNHVRHISPGSFAILDGNPSRLILAEQLGGRAPARHKTAGENHCALWHRHHSANERCSRPIPIREFHKEVTRSGNFHRRRPCHSRESTSIKKPNPLLYLAVSLNNLSEVIKADEDFLIRDAPRLVPDDVLERPIPLRCGRCGRAGWTPKSGVATSAQSTRF